MSPKFFVLTVFAAWSVLCGYWYVCGIKQVCTPRVQATVPAQADHAGGIEPDTASQEPAFQPITTPETDVSTQPSDKPGATHEPDIDKVHVEELEDHAVIHFPYNSTRKEDNDAIDEYLSRLARQLVQSGGSVTLTGHTDNVGDGKTNEAFAMRRAKNIRDILLAKGVKRNQITTKSFGERKPVASNDTARGRYKNRRVEIRVK